MIVKDLFNKLTNALIINISSVSDRIPDAEFSLYCSSKAASTRFFEAVAKELPNSRTFSFLPTYVDTPLLKTIHKDDGFDFDPILKTNDIVRLIQKLEDGQLDIESGSNPWLWLPGTLRNTWIEERFAGFKGTAGDHFSYAAKVGFNKLNNQPLFIKSRW